MTNYQFVIFQYKFIVSFSKNSKFIRIRTKNIDILLSQTNKNNSFIRI